MKFLYRLIVAYALEHLFIKPDPRRIKRGLITAEQISSGAVARSKLGTRQVANPTLGPAAVR